MFTIEQIEEVHASLGKKETLRDYVQALAMLGVARYESFVSDGHSEYIGRDDRRVLSKPAHDELTVAQTSDRDALLDQWKRHQQGETSYYEMSRGLADCGVEKWTVDTHAMTMTVHDRSGAVLLVEQIM